MDIRIRCMHCNTLIRDVFWRVDEREDVVFIRVRCHGAEASMTTGRRQLHDFRHVEGQAFAAPPPLLGPPP